MAGGFLIEQTELLHALHGLIYGNMITFYANTYIGCNKVGYQLAAMTVLCEYKRGPALAVLSSDWHAFLLVNIYLYIYIFLINLLKIKQGFYEETLFVQ